MYLGGKIVSTLKGTLLYDHPKFIWQKVAGVMTEVGFIKQSPIIYSWNSKENPYLVELLDFHEEINDFFYWKELNKNQLLNE